MSYYFNEDQAAHMEELADAPDKRVCWCGWYWASDEVHRKYAGEEQCRAGKTRADKRAGLLNQNKSEER